MSGGRRLASRALAVVGAIALVAAFVTAYVSRALFDADQFADRATTALESDAVQAEIGARTADGLVAVRPNLIAARPIIKGAAESVVRGAPFRALYRAAVFDLHTAFFDQDRDKVALELEEVGAVVRDALQGLEPRLAARIPAAGDATSIEFDAPVWAAGLLQAADAARWLPWALAALGALLLAGAFGAAAAGRDGLRGAGLTILVTAAVALAALLIGEAVVLDDLSGVDREALDAVWDAFLGDLRTGLILIALCGGVLALATTLALTATGEVRRSGVRAIALAGIVVAAVVASASVFAGAGGITQEPLEIETVGCNGADEFCDRPYDQLATPATHNSMSAATYPGWKFAQQERGIAAQLRAGVRGLFIDAYPGVETKRGVVKTDLSDIRNPKRAALEEAAGPRATAAAERIRNRVVNSPEADEPGVYLCHSFCEVGAITIDRGFTEIREFVAANPDEVVTVVIEDYVEPEAIAAAAERTGLIEYVYEGPVGAPWPTLEEIIDSGGRVVMMAENETGGDEFPWYHSAYEALVQETPFRFTQAKQLTKPSLVPASCEANRGGDSARVFLVNHWVDTSPAPRPSNAALVNTRSALLERIEECERLRGLPATLVSIDFYEEGDLFGAVAALNASR